MPWKPWIIADLNQKGGAGKTTTSVGIASALTEASYVGLLLDGDPQGSALSWAAVRTRDPLFSVVGMPHANIHRDLPRLAEDYDFVVIDGPPRVDAIAKSAIMAADIVLIPVQPSPYDIWAAEDIVNMVKEAQIYKPTLKCAFVINRKISGTNLGRDVTKALAKYGIPVLPTAIYQRVIHAEAAINGLTLNEADPSNPAAAEMRSVTAETLALLNGHVSPEEWLPREDEPEEQDPITVALKELNDIAKDTTK
jgi:chromosome partitioning protein